LIWTIVAQGLFVRDAVVDRRYLVCAFAFAFASASLVVYDRVDDVVAVL
jgi:hypothetical protein